MASKTFMTAKTKKDQIATRRRNEKVRNVALVAGSVLVLLALFWLLLNHSPAQNVVPARMGATLGNFSLMDINGTSVRLSDYKGKTVLINAWATWCPPCKAEMPLLNRYYQSHVQDGFVLLAVNAGDTQEQAASFASENELTFPVLLDPGTRLLNQLAINSFPTSILIGPDGKVKTVHVGMFTPEGIEEEITPLLTQ
jgi:peroxiredoxin